MCECHSLAKIKANATNFLQIYNVYLKNANLTLQNLIFKANAPCKHNSTSQKDYIKSNIA